MLCGIGGKQIRDKIGMGNSFDYQNKAAYNYMKKSEG